MTICKGQSQKLMVSKSIKLPGLRSQNSMYYRVLSKSSKVFFTDEYFFVKEAHKKMVKFSGGSVLVFGMFWSQRLTLLRSITHVLVKLYIKTCSKTMHVALII